MFSIIMPVYNGERFIDAAIKSVFSQTETDWELIVVDDGSSDGTPDLLKKYDSSDKVRIITQKNQGAAAARNRGASEAKGTHFAFLDADDVWNDNHLSVIKELILKYPSAGLYATFAKIELKNGNIVSECAYFNGRETDVCLDDFFEEYNRDRSVKLFQMSTTCILREAFWKAGGFPDGCAMGEDLELSLRVAAYYPTALSAKCTAVYKAVNSTASKDRSFDAEWRFFDTVKALYADEEIPSGKRKNLERTMAWFTMRRCRHYIIDGQKRKAWRAFFETDRTAVANRDLAVNLLLLILPCSLARRIFAVRWRGKA